MRIITIILFSVCLTGCMSDHEYMLRKQNAANQASHQPVYQPLVMRGPVTLGAGSEVVVTAQTQPFAPINVTDGMATQRAIVRDVLTGAVIGYGLHSAGDVSVSKGNSNNTSTGSECVAP